MPRSRLQGCKQCCPFLPPSEAIDIEGVTTDCAKIDAREDGGGIARKSVEILLQDELLQISFQQEQSGQ